MGKLEGAFYEMQLIEGRTNDGKVGYRLEPWKQEPTKADIERQDQLWERVFSGAEEMLDAWQAYN
jgi:hypothetical protein